MDALPSDARPVTWARRRQRALSQAAWPVEGLGCGDRKDLHVAALYGRLRRHRGEARRSQWLWRWGCTRGRMAGVEHARGMGERRGRRVEAGEVEITLAESVVRSRACAVHSVVIRFRGTPTPTTVSLSRLAPGPLNTVACPVDGPVMPECQNAIMPSSH